eukprot:CAMPEP_0201534008 /NCGR_PEP_ID=MMETSP0161_2-20130828/54948_1 /ASSEMBLY_ACC=CAM_ASM_000251 /TAXON_ID=180227 /ORGANISM="Neoparamoeba aestuarina, Strain SoJaBio B1-5/56/2" /LENGTH=260 /DNA_ID=CAMNT_0047938399 /DNA_START=92 /DNA_END=874 /DNA_ORIENTATION=+
MALKLIKEWKVEDADGVVSLSRYPAPLDHVMKLHMNSTPQGQHFENRFSPNFMAVVKEALNQAVKEKEAARQGALIITSSGKFWSNGLQPEAMVSSDGSLIGEQYLNTYMLLCRDLMTLPMPVIAACQGHAFAGGMLWALCSDVRVASSDKGFWCMNEIDLGLNIPPALLVIIKDKIRDPQFRMKVILEGVRFKAQELLDEGVVEAIAPSSEVEKEALKIAERMAPKSGSGAFAPMKKQLYLNTYEALTLGVDYKREAKL